MKKLNFLFDKKNVFNTISRLFKLMKVLYEVKLNYFKREISLTSNLFFNQNLNMAGMIATKLEMTRVIKGDRFIPVTLLQIPDMKVVGLKAAEKDGYDALIVGVCDKVCEGNLGEDKSTLNKSEFKIIREFPLNKEEVDKFKIGDTIGLDNLEGIENVNVEGFSKGKGFTGAMAKHNFHGGPGGHGSKFHRALGSIGNRKPTRTHKGKKMHGHHGNIKVTLKKLPLEIINKEMGVIGVRGGVPGGRKSLIKIMF